MFSYTFPEYSFWMFIIIFIITVFIHELGHVIAHLMMFNHWPNVTISKTYVKVSPTKEMYVRENQVFLAAGILLGLVAFVPFMFFYEVESVLAMIAYIISCSRDFWHIIKLEVIKFKKENGKE